MNHTVWCTWVSHTYEWVTHMSESHIWIIRYDVREWVTHVSKSHIWIIRCEWVTHMSKSHIWIIQYDVRKWVTHMSKSHIWIIRYDETHPAPHFPCSTFSPSQFAINVNYVQQPQSKITTEYTDYTATYDVTFSLLHTSPARHSQNISSLLMCTQ